MSYADVSTIEKVGTTKQYQFKRNKNHTVDFQHAYNVSKQLGLKYLPMFSYNNYKIYCLQRSFALPVGQEFKNSAGLKFVE